MTWWTRLRSWLGGPAEGRGTHTLKEVDFWLHDVGWGATTTEAGIAVTDTNVCQVPEVFAGVETISQDVARCPLKVQSQTADGDWIDAPQHGLWEILHDLANPETTSASFFASLIRDLLIHECAYAEIVRDGTGVVRALWRLDPTRLEVTRNGLNQKVYAFRRLDGGQTVWTFDASRPPLLDLAGFRSPLRQCRDLIGLALALDTYAAKFFANSARPSGVLETARTLTEPAMKRLKDQWMATYGGSRNAHKVAVLEEGVAFKPITATNEQAQFLELRKFVRTQIAGALKVPPHKIGDLERATFANIENQSREYVASLAPLFTLLQQSIRRDLLTTRQYPRYRAVFDFETLIETDIQSRMSAFATARQNGIYSADDCRRKLRENPIGRAQGGDRYHMNGNMIPLTGPVAAPPSPGLGLTPDPAPADEVIQ